MAVRIEQILLCPDKGELLIELRKAIQAVDKRAKVRKLTKPYEDLAHIITDRVLSEKQGVVNHGDTGSARYAVMSSYISVAWIQRHGDLIIRFIAERDTHSDISSLFHEDSPLHIVLHRRIEMARSRRKKTRSTFLKSVLGEEFECHITGYRDFVIVDADELMTATLDSAIVRDGSKMWLCLRGHAVQLPEYMKRDASFWKKEMTSAERIKVCRQWAVTTGYLEEDPLDDIAELIEGIDGHRDRAIKAIHHLMRANELTLEDITEKKVTV